jgi:cytochrome c biogenesis protein CcmG/thiol:disulfide interchange protein DsbE
MNQPLPTPLTRRSALTLIGASAAWPSWAASAGEAAPPFALPGLDAPVTLALLKGRVVLLDFWASWCGPCKQSFPWLAQLQQRHGPAGLRVVAVNVDRQREKADAFLAQVPARFAVAFDPTGEVARLYAIKGMPSSVLVSADGRVLLHHTGFRDDDRAPLEAAVAAALKRVAP